jgi:hypothetical protein
MNRKVDFLIIGTQKAGTTSLFQYLLQHHEIYFSEVKEVNYFVVDHLYARGEKYYHSFFSGFKNQKVIGSAFVHMLPCLKAIDRVYHYNPNMKFIVMLRNPIDRAVSSFKYAIRNGWEDSSTTIMSALKLEQDRLKQEEYNLTYFYNGLYNLHLTNWMKKFPKENFIILKQEDLQNAPQQTMDALFNFLHVTNRSIDTSNKYNVASGVHNRNLQKFMLAKRNPVSRILGAIMPQQTKVYVRSKIFPIIYRINTNKVKETPVSISEKEQEQLKQYFKLDQEALRSNFNIHY